MSISIEYFGTAASVIVAISLTQKNIKRLRILNFIGALAFGVYGLLIASWPVFGLNTFIAFIDLYYLIDMKRRKNYFELLTIDKPESSVYLARFIEFYRDDIVTFMPSFEPENLGGIKAVFILRDLLPVSLVLYTQEDVEIEVLVDFAIPAYRDMKNASYFFNKIAETFNEGETVFVTRAGSNLHNKYLRKIGFSYSSDRLMWIYSK